MTLSTNHTTSHAVSHAINHWDVVIIGAGASGLMCAATAGYNGKRVLVLDHAPKAAAKIRISGGGKCNFTNLTVTPAHFICQNPHFVKSALSRYPSSAFIELVERHGLEYETRELGKLFCTQRASDLIQILRTECDWAGVEVQTHTQLNTVRALPEEGGFVLDITDTLNATHSVLQTQKVVVASGALSFAKLKASGLGYQLAKQFGLNVLTTSPGLVPLVFEGKWSDRIAALSGVALDVVASCQQAQFAEAMLFTHNGLSGPAMLQISNYWHIGEPVHINLLPGLVALDELKKLKNSGQSLVKWLNQTWPKRFTQAWLEWFPIEHQLSNVPDELLADYAQKLTQWTLYPNDTAGYDKAEVTLGGVDTDEVSSKTFEAKKQPGLYFIGEVLDVTGQLGGYNFQWAWASGVACGLAL
ncbi:NAD(P)/FAD-dependent oxidoreductase [Thiomicrorhabdus aquaedulcis]|uniref:NAD(P)/FAD-dependent oxidoreductase n=1 Tax=Thiomicrorhabdus aquaedulcis TaxID=2211106 RepID=UPI001561D40E|nr:NAD(P)/FAD-dependent oxidoreductase [Thiomicrorhabdus aquaedulcis]